MLNDCTFIGLVGNKKLTETSTGKPMLFFSVKTWDKENKATYIECTAYAALAERIHADFPDGRIIYLETKASIYKDKAGNNKTSFVVESFEYCSPKAAS